MSSRKHHSEQSLGLFKHPLDLELPLSTVGNTSVCGWLSLKARPVVLRIKVHILNFISRFRLYTFATSKYADKRKDGDAAKIERLSKVPTEMSIVLHHNTAGLNIKD